MIPCSYWALTCCAALPSCKTLYVISVRQTRDLPVVSLFPHPASFRFHLTMNTLAFGYILPTTGRIPDFHRLETCAAGRTEKKALRLYRSAFAFLISVVYINKTECQYIPSMFLKKLRISEGVPTGLCSALIPIYSTVTDLARFLGLSTSRPLPRDT